MFTLDLYYNVFHWAIVLGIAVMVASSFTTMLLVIKMIRRLNVPDAGGGVRAFFPLKKGDFDDGPVEDIYEECYNGKEDDKDRFDTAGGAG